MKNVLVTGAAGFIGYHFVKQMLQDEDCNVIGLDCLNSYYDVTLKVDRLKQLGVTQHGRGWESQHKRFRFIEGDLSSKERIVNLLKECKVNYIVHLAAQAGVRYSTENPDAYVDSNIAGFVNICESIREYPIEHFVFASSSSVYGIANEVPYKEEDNTSSPISLYGASKKANEVIAHSYSHLYDIPTTGLRFFTVYGEWGRPDMAYFLFADLITQEKPIKVCNHGNLSRDFTYVSDIVTSMKLLLFGKRSIDDNLFEVYNIGNSSPIRLMDFIETIEKHLGKEAGKKYLEMQEGDVYHTYADVQKLYDKIQFKPQVSLDEGIEKFIIWYKSYYKV